MRNLRWAAELAIDADLTRASLGVDQLDALRNLEALDDYERFMVKAALGSIEPRSRRDEEA